MLSWLRRLWAPAGAGLSDELLNESLHLAMEWGADWLKPVQGRLAARHPELSGDQLDALDAASRAAMKFGHARVIEMARKSGARTRCEDFEPAMRARYAWVSRGNVERLFRQGMYYAWKDNGLD